MNYALVLILAIAIQVNAQPGCALTQPDSLTTWPTLTDVVTGTPVTFYAHGGNRDTVGWYALYFDHCCEYLIDTSTTGIFHFTPTATDIFLCRIESPCDTTGPVGMELDVYPLLTSLPLEPDIVYERVGDHWIITSSQIITGITISNLLGQVLYQSHESEPTIQVPHIPFGIMMITTNNYRTIRRLW